MFIIAEIVLSYVFIEKEKHEEKTVQELILQMLDEISCKRDDETIVMDSGDKHEIFYRIVQKKNSDKCYLELISKMRVNTGIIEMKKIDEKITKSQLQKYFEVIKDYDGISEYFCCKLFPQYAVFERRIRRLILQVLIKAFGSSWREKTFSQEEIDAMKERARGKLSLSATLEQMDLASLEKYLFEKREVAYQNVVKETIDADQAEKMSKQELYDIIEQLKPYSLWGKYFSSIGDEDVWRQKIESIHDVRNKIAHQKTVTQEEYIATKKSLNELNKMLTKAVDSIQEDNFTEMGIIDILGSFAVLAGKVIKTVVQSQTFHDVISSINERIQELVKPIEQEYLVGSKAALIEMQKYLSSSTNMQRQIENVALVADSVASAANVYKNYSKTRPEIPAAAYEAIEMAQRVNNMVPSVYVPEIP